MTTFWTQLEDTSGARLQGEHCYFDRTDHHGETVAAPLSHYGFLRVKGPDAHKFLQGQATADFRQVTTSSAQRGAYCTPKGRMITSFIAACPAEHDILLRMRRNIVDSSQAVLAKYAVFSKAELTNASEHMIAVGVAGKQAADAVKHLLGEAPATQFAVVSTDKGLAIQTDQNGQRFELWLPANKAFDHWQQLTAQTTVMNSTAWDDLSIADGVADVCAATAEELIPQMLNYDAIGAVNFKKGCYTGQEVVARLHYRGTAKRRLYRASVSSGQVSEGEEVFADDKAQAVGLIAARSDSAKVLVVLARDALDAERLHSTSGATITDVLPPPYELKE